MPIPHNITNLLRTDTNGYLTEDLTGGILPPVDGSNLTGVIGNTYLAPVDPGPNDDGFGNSSYFPDTLFQIGQSWFNYDTEKLFHCVSNASNNARWNENLQGFGSNFVSLAGSVPIPRGAVVRLDTSGSSGNRPVVVAAVDGDDGIVGVSSVYVNPTLTDVTFQVISVGIVKVLVSNVEPNWTRGDAIYLSSLPGVATSTPTSRLIGYAAKAATTGTVLRDIFVGFGSGGGGGGGGGNGDLHTVVQNKKNIDADYSLDANYNGIIAGPVTIDVGVTFTIPPGSRLVVL
jgi:hypothetical protein